MKNDEIKILSNGNIGILDTYLGFKNPMIKDGENKNCFYITDTYNSSFPFPLSVAYSKGVLEYITSIRLNAKNKDKLEMDTVYKNTVSFFKRNTKLVTEIRSNINGRVHETSFATDLTYINILVQYGNNLDEQSNYFSVNVRLKILDNLEHKQNVDIHKNFNETWAEYCRSLYREAINDKLQKSTIFPMKQITQDKFYRIAIISGIVILLIFVLVYAQSNRYDEISKFVYFDKWTHKIIEAKP